MVSICLKFNGIHFLPAVHCRVSVLTSVGACKFTSWFSQLNAMVSFFCMVNFPWMPSLVFSETISKAVPIPKVFFSVFTGIDISDFWITVGCATHWLFFCSHQNCCAQESCVF